MAARLAASHATDTKIARLRAAVNDNAAALNGSDGALMEIDDRHDQDFHFALAQYSRNPMLTELLCAELYPLLRLYRGLPVDARPANPACRGET